MPFYQPGHFEVRGRIAFVVCGVVLTVGFLLVGLFKDLAPSPPRGELVPAMVEVVVPDGLGTPYYVSVRAVTSRGTVNCSMGKSQFPDGVLPPLDARIQVDWTPGYCDTYVPVEQAPRWFFFLVSGIAGTVTGSYLFGRTSRSR
ncbi:hypothetical protein Q0Z83_022500 [Actinoplanes sichuanensis]|uniref:DUF3592 domain-containing protein n=1 Tax=Actinoplanes sichuanensis TaxID=512349 RepID=A0ABW4AJH7_9ACTN|nr:hypothetical protein [Actinoplanes sichuanensis]BEL04059.1 hypothetical protein Q0Z83_022500 [Actinoplanes sichuanensis]